MTSDAAAARIYIAIIVIAVTLFFVAPWIADAIFIAVKAFVQAWAVGAYN